MNNQILGLNANTFYVIIVVIILVILGVISFHYFAYVSTQDALFKIGFGAGVTVLETKNKETFQNENDNMFVQPLVGNEQKGNEQCMNKMNDEPDAYDSVSYKLHPIE